MLTQAVDSGNFFIEVNFHQDLNKNFDTPKKISIEFEYNTDQNICNAWYNS